MIRPIVVTFAVLALAAVGVAYVVATALNAALGPLTP